MCIFHNAFSKLISPYHKLPHLQIPPLGTMGYTSEGRERGLIKKVSANIFSDRGSHPTRTSFGLNFVPGRFVVLHID